MLVDNQKMLSFLSDTDVEKYYHICNDIISSGEDYSLREVVFFCLEENPSDVFVCLRRYDDGECLISAYTDNCELVVEAIEYCKNAKLVTDNNLYSVKRLMGRYRSMHLFLPAQKAKKSRNT